MKQKMRYSRNVLQEKQSISPIISEKGGGNPHAEAQGAARHAIA
jgi:hypothetical protein